MSGFYSNPPSLPLASTITFKMHGLLFLAVKLLLLKSQLFGRVAVGAQIIRCTFWIHLTYSFATTLQTPRLAELRFVKVATRYSMCYGGWCRVLFDQRGCSLVCEQLGGAVLTSSVAYSFSLSCCRHNLSSPEETTIRGHSNPG